MTIFTSIFTTIIMFGLLGLQLYHLNQYFDNRDEHFHGVVAIIVTLILIGGAIA